ncbi:ACT domain-containing protein ACR11 [Citrus sinensis]|uniref:ACT domain-containing protein ACR11 n=1 Tax=Citrus sinensis TaxID=2711 RepID=A0ACB8JEB6_CITSI|nr:ACT domain-containing protein ACR11 [Citrus sinensis]
MLVCSDTGRKVDDPEVLEAIRLIVINNLLQYHPESSSQLAMGVTFGVDPPKQQVISTYEERRNMKLIIFIRKANLIQFMAKLDEVLYLILLVLSLVSGLNSQSTTFCIDLMLDEFSCLGFRAAGFCRWKTTFCVGLLLDVAECGVDVDIATHISIYDDIDGPKRSLLLVETADRPGLLVDLVKIFTVINVNVESGEFDTEGLLAKAKFHVSYKGKAIIKPLQQVLANSLRYFLR